MAVVHDLFVVALLLFLAQLHTPNANMRVWSSNHDDPTTGKLEINYEFIDIIDNH